MPGRHAASQDLFLPLEATGGVREAALGRRHDRFGASDTAARNKSLHATLAKEPFFALRFGELFLEGWRLKKRILRKAGPRIEIDSDDIEPNIRQKGVDMRIGLDIASLTLKKQVQVIVLVTGDSVPA
jgi:hypothetical protein